MAYGTGAMGTFGGMKLQKIRRRLVRFGGAIRPATGTTTVRRLGLCTSVFAPSWNLWPLNL